MSSPTTTDDRAPGAPVTPGRYIALRREAAGLSVGEVASAIRTLPAIGTTGREEWLRLVESDQVPISADIVDALREEFAFDPYILVELVALHAGGALPQPEICRSCGCTWDDPCADGCGWRTADRDLCTSCPEPAIAAGAAA